MSIHQKRHEYTKGVCCCHSYGTLVKECDYENYPLFTEMFLELNASWMNSKLNL